MKQELTAEQLAALQQVAKYYGRTWKQSLRQAWETGKYGCYMDDAASLQTIRNTFGPSWLVSFHLPNEIPGKVTLSPKSARAAQKYGLDACIKAYARNQEGYGASTIAFENGWRTNQADAAINAGEEYTVFTTGHGLPYGAPVACCIADGCGRRFNPSEPEQRDPLTLKPFWKRYCPEHRMNPAGLQVPIVNIPPVTGSHYDYKNQAWTLDGKYIACAHPASMACGCYGKEHAGEFAPIENLPTAQETAIDHNNLGVSIYAASLDHTYEVVVGNVGTVYSGPDAKQANNDFETYAEQSRTGYGRAAGESVTVFEDGQIIAEHILEPEDSAPPETRRVDQIPGELAFTCDSTEVAEIRANFQLTDYDSFFVGIGDGDYTEVWGMHGTVPENSRTVYRVL